LKQYKALNENIDFIAIDLSALAQTNEEDKQRVVNYFEDNYYPIINADLDRLEEEGLFDRQRLFIPDGVLLQIQSVESSYGEKYTYLIII